MPRGRSRASGIPREGDDIGLEMVRSSGGRRGRERLLKTASWVDNESYKFARHFQLPFLHRLLPREARLPATLDAANRGTQSQINAD